MAPRSLPAPSCWNSGMCCKDMSNVKWSNNLALLNYFLNMPNTENYITKNKRIKNIAWLLDMLILLYNIS